MSGKSLVDIARENRSSGSVLKVRLSNLRSKRGHAIVFIVEGHDDIGPYQVWVQRIRENVETEFIAGAGKSQLLDLLRRLRNDKTGLANGSYILLDHDYDGLRDEPCGPEVYCTSAYSIENYLVSSSVLSSLLSDEFRCTGETDERDTIIELFENVAQQFVECMRDTNRRIFFARKLGLRDLTISPKITNYVKIALSTVEKNYADFEALKKLIVLTEEPSVENQAIFEAEFQSLDPLEQYRGKFLMSFFQYWLRLLAAELKAPVELEAVAARAHKFSDHAITLRALATRSDIPDKFRQFVLEADAP